MPTGTDDTAELTPASPADAAPGGAAPATLAPTSDHPPAEQPAADPTGETAAALIPSDQHRAALEAVRAEYEGEGGHLARLRSGLDKRNAETEAQLRAQQQQIAAMQEQIRAAGGAVPEGTEATGDAADQVRALSARVQELEAQTAAASFDQAASQWTADVLEHLDLDPGDEAVAAIADDIGDLRQPGATHEYLARMAEHAVAQQRERAAQAENTLQETLDSLDGRIQAAVAQHFSETGLGAVDTGAPAGQPAEDLTSRSVTSLLAEGLRAMRFGRQS